MVDLDFTGRVAVITGAGAGLGRSHALLLGSRGAAVVVNDLSVDPETGVSRAQSVVDEITAAGGTATADTNSVTSPEGGEAIIAGAIATYGSVDIVVNNAGIVRDKTFVKMSSELLDPVLDVHLRGAFHVTIPAARFMKEAGYGRIVSTTSAAGLFGNFGQTNYGAAKMGLIGMSRVLALENEKYNIRANVIGPIAATSMTEGVLDEYWTSRLKPELVSPAVAFLAHESCQVNGEIFSVAAGRVARIFIGEGRGFYSPTLTPEDIRDNWDAVVSEVDYRTPMSAAEERDLLQESLEAFESSATLSS